MGIPSRSALLRVRDVVDLFYRSRKLVPNHNEEIVNHLYHAGFQTGVSFL